MLSYALLAIALAQRPGDVLDSRESLARTLRDLGYKVELHPSSASVKMQRHKIMTEIILLSSARKPGFTRSEWRGTALIIFPYGRQVQRGGVELSLRAVFHTPQGTNLAEVRNWFRDKAPTSATVRMDGVVFVTSGAITTDVHGSDLPGAIRWFTKNAFAFTSRFKAVNLNPLQRNWAGWQLPDSAKANIAGIEDLRALLTQWGWSYQWPPDVEPDPRVGRFGGQTCDGTIDGVDVSFSVSTNRIFMWSKVQLDPATDVPALMKRLGAIPHHNLLEYVLHNKGVRIMWPPGDQLYTVTDSIELTGRTLGPVREDVLKFARLVKGMPRS